MTINPQTTLYLCSVPIENDYKNQLTFANRNAQRSYFESKVVETYINTTYIRKDQPIEVPFTYDDIANINYLYFVNNGHSAKYYYCFITRIEYVNENCSRIYIETDVFQTWYFNIHYNQCFVEREHVKDDSVGSNTITENLETGEYMQYGNEYIEDLNLANSDIVLAATIDPFQSTDNQQVFVNGKYNGIPTGAGYFAFRKDDYASAIENVQHLTDIGAESSIVGLFLAPHLLTNQANGLINNSNTPATLTVDIHGSDTPYTVKNNKLKCYPYAYVRVTNGASGSLVLKPELFTYQDNRQFRVKACLTPGCSIIGYPINYNGADEDITNSLVLGKFPTLSYATDSYINWMTENALNQIYGSINGAMEIGGGITQAVTNPTNVGAGMNETIGGAEKIGNIMYSRYLADRVPPQLGGNINSGDVMTSSNNLTFKFEYMYLREEYAKCIDDYFSCYGYKVNRIKVPNITGRRNWNFVKTIDANMSGSIPQDDLNKIRDMFNNGVTFWHNPNNIFNYSLNNDII